MAAKKASRKKTARKKGNGKSLEGEYLPNKGGRPTRYNKTFPEQAYKLCLLKCTDEELAEQFHVHVATLYEWKNKYPEFAEAIRRGKTPADAEVAFAAYQRAVGYSHPEEKIFLHEGEVVRVNTVKHYPPDPKVLSLWLRNRQRENWREEKHVMTERPLQELTLEELEELEKRLEREKQALLGHDGGAENQ